MRYLPILFLVLILSCKANKPDLTAQQIIDKAIAFSGANLVANAQISFHFRDKSYTAFRKNGIFVLDRVFNSDATKIKDVVSNNGFQRFLNGLPVAVVDSMAVKYGNSVNSVHYFSVLPFGLNDKAVQKKLLAPALVNGKEYFKIEISFSEDGGGEDFEDVFLYWIGKTDFLIDYIAYSYHTNGGGKRFRVLKEQCIKDGIRFVDYQNYKPISESVSLINLDTAFEEGQLQKVSEIVLKDIEVTIFDESIFKDHYSLFK
ncbi:DUF6503 family protein [Polaribacter sp. HL-MS24]|uniref:DUF6503 family protein n=1 Tax=Polaribacter sp. HL-MS24 TaxID=3077735 RepID=UPI002934796E|nr:DUF6503 family protein [Polaribacter sp. HL-MS24]WOC40433.1 DUF6503 family protein [Polaribacter sp. HL-MS24]